MLESIKARYSAGFVTVSQLERYVKLGMITEDDSNTILGGAKQTETVEMEGE